jgi:hypothetical protein
MEVIAAPVGGTVRRRFRRLATAVTAIKTDGAPRCIGWAAPLIAPATLIVSYVVASSEIAALGAGVADTLTADTLALAITRTTATREVDGIADQLALRAVVACTAIAPHAAPAVV